MLQALNYSFDGGVVPMVLALLTGNSLLHVPDRLWLEGDTFTEYLRDNGVTHLNGTPTFYKHIGLGEVPSLRRMVVGGEALDAACFQEMTRSPEEWVQWAAATRKAITLNATAVAGSTTGEKEQRLVHEHCRRRHRPRGSPTSPALFTTGAWLPPALAPAE